MLLQHTRRNFRVLCSGSRDLVPLLALVSYGQPLDSLPGTRSIRSDSNKLKIQIKAFHLRHGDMGITSSR